MKESNYLTKVLLQTNEHPKTKEKTIIFDRITPSCAIFSLYGTEIDKYIEKLMIFRAIDQKSSADTVTKTVFKEIFKPSSAPKFNFMIRVKKEYNRKELEKEFGKSINISKLFSLDPEKNPTFYKAEIDGRFRSILCPNQLIRKISMDILLSK